MKIVDNTAKSSVSTNLNYIPVGTVFRGNVLGSISNQWVRGTFFKAGGPFSLAGTSYDCIIVCLDDDFPKKSIGYSNLYLRCSTVNDYEPLEVELRVVGPAKG